MEQLEDSRQEFKLQGQFQWDPISELELKVSEENKEDYDEIMKLLTQVLTYPSTQAAEIHMHSDRLGTEDLKENIFKRGGDKDGESSKGSNLEFCSCCGFVRQEKNLSLCTHFREINNVGISTYLYFETIKNLVILLAILSSAYSIYALVTNLLASGVIKADGSLEFSYANSYNGLSLGSKQLNVEQLETNSQYYRIQCWIGLGVMVLWFFMFFILKYFEKDAEDEVEEETISAADFTICIENVPEHISQKELQEALDTYFATINNVPEYLKQPFNIKKFNKGVPFYLNEDFLENKELDNLRERHEELVEKFIDLIKERQEHTTFSISKEEREQMYKEFYENSAEQIKKYKVISEEITKQIESSSKDNREATTTIFVTLETTDAVKLITSLNDSSFIGQARYLLSCCQSDNKFVYYEKKTRYNVKVRRAPEPEDIVWSNIGVSYWEKVKRKLITYFITLILLSVSFGIAFGLSEAQENNPTNKILSFAVSIIISVINIILVMVIRQLCAYEKNFTETDYQASLAVKAIFASLINSILIPMIVNRFIKKNIYEENGLASDIFMLGITNSFLTPTLKLIDPNYIINRLLKWKASWPESRLSMNQQQLNESYSFMVFEVGYEYVYMVSLFLFTCFFVSLQPIISFFAILGLGMMYWTQKNSLLNRMRRPIPGTDIVNLSMFQLIICGGLFYCLGSLTWSNFLPEGVPKDAIVPNLIALGVSLLMVIMPYNQILKLLMMEDGLSRNKEYEKCRIFLPSEYDRLNPATSKEALAEFHNFCEKEFNRIENAPEAEKNNLFTQFTKQKARGHHNPQGGNTAKHSIGLEAMLMPAQKLIEQNQQMQNGFEPNFLQGLQTTMNEQPKQNFRDSFAQMQQGSFHNRMSRHMGKQPSWHHQGFAPHQNFGFHNIIHQQNGFQPLAQQSPGIVQVGAQSNFQSHEHPNFQPQRQFGDQGGNNVSYY